MRRLSEQVASQQSELETQQSTMQRLEQQMKELQARSAAAAAPSAEPTAKAEAATNAPAVAIGKASTEGARETTDDARKSLLIYGYVQGQFQTDQSSQNELSQDGRPLNQNRFLVPRARLVAEREWKFASILLELDGNTLNGPGFSLQRAEATILHRGSNPVNLPPQLSVTLGQFRVPFGEENLQSSAVRYFMERSLPSRAMFPSEIDLGLRVAGAISWFRYSVAATNGQPLGSADFPLQDPDSAKDLVGRLGVAVKATDAVDFTAGFSSLVGKGFHPETAGAKPQLQWIDNNGDGTYQPGEVTGLTGVASRSSSTFKRIGLAADGQINFRWKTFGVSEQTQLGGAFYLGNNMDRGLFYSDPVLSGRDTRHIGYMLSLVQEVGDWVVAGFRTDYFNPDSDATDWQNAQLVQPTDRSMRTFSPLIGLRYERRARLIFQYDAVRDKLGRDQAGIPTDLKNDRMTVRLQVNL
jgi:Phosphate-selective porin O and P